MQPFRTFRSTSCRPHSAVATAMLAVLTLCFLASSARAQTTPTVVMTQTSLLAGYPAGGAYGSGNAAGSSFAVNSLGNLIAGTSYGGSLVQFDGTTGAVTTLGSLNNPGPVAVDAMNNAYVGDVYDSSIVKIPFVSGAYVSVSTTSGSTPVCTGSDTAECILPAFTLPSGDSIAGYATMVIDSAGDLFFSTTSSSSPANAIYECNAACFASATPTAVLLYTEPTATNQLLVGGLAVDPYGDLFFTDSAFSSISNEESVGSNLNELVYTKGTGFSATPTVLYSYTVSSPANYDNQFDGVAVDASGTVYFADQNDGIFAFTNNNGVVNTATMYQVATQGAKILTTDGKGNFFVTAYSNTAGGDAASKVSVNLLTAPATTSGTATTATNITTFLNDGDCTSTPTVAFTASEAGTPTTEFSATTTGGCASTFTGGASFPTSVTFNPAGPGNRSATLTATDSHGSTATALVSGAVLVSPPTFSPAAGTYTSIQSVVISDVTTGASIYYTTDGSTPTTSSTLYTGTITVSSTETINAIATATGYPASSAVTTAAYTINLPAATPVIAPAGGTYTTIQSVTITDSTPGATIYYTTDGTTPTTTSPTYAGPIRLTATATVQAIATATGYTTSPVASTSFTINLPPPSFTLALNTQALNLLYGGTGVVQVTVTSQNLFASAVSFACTGLPSGGTCSFSPTTATPTSTTAATTTLTIATPGSTAAIQRETNPLFPGATLALAFCLLGFGKRRRLRMLAMLIVGVAGLGLVSGCNSSTSTAVNVTTSTVTVTATSGSLSSSETLTITLQ
jgi:hypothetical protein